MPKPRTLTEDGGYAIYDRIEALNQVGGNASTAKELLSMMLTELPEQSLELDAAIRAADVEGLARIAHRINGSASCCGAPALAAACRALRRGVQASAEEDIPLLVELLQDQIRAFLDHCD
jgi:two-component system sensor histidine kinase BarA